MSPGTVFLQTNFPLRKVTSMAKASVGGLDLKAIRTMLTAAERRVFDSSVGREIVAAGREQLQAAISQARTLRDKWRDLYAQQTRTTKRTAKAGTPANDRSREKSELFAGALVRLEARLAEVGTAMKSAVKKAGKAAKRKKNKEDNVGFVDWLFLDADVRVTRGSKGSLFVHTRDV